MSRFGWAYVNDVITGSGGSGSVPGGSDKAIQFASGSAFSGSTNFTFDYDTNIVRLTGTLYADNLIVSSSQILKSGSTIFGDSAADTHQFTGSVYLNNPLYSVAVLSSSDNLYIGGSTTLKALDAYGAINAYSTLSGTTAQFTTLTGSQIKVGGSTLTTTGSLTVHGSTKLGSYGTDTHQFTGSVYLDNSLNVNAATNITGNLRVVGQVSASNTIITNSDITAVGNITSLAGVVSASSGLASGGSITAATDITAKNLISGSSLQISNGGTFGGPVTVTGSVSASVGLQTAGAVTAGTNLTVENFATIKNGLIVTGSSTVSGNLTVLGTLSASYINGNGTGITDIQGTNVNGVGDDWTIQVKDGNTGTLTGSSNLTFSGSILALTGTLTGSSLVISASVISASAYLGITGGSTTPGGTNTNIQFNSGSTFSGSSNLTYDYTTNNLSLTGALLMSGTAYISEVDYIDFDVSASIPAYKAARLFHDTTTNDLSYYLPLANQALQIGQQTVVKVKNSTGSPISKGKLVRISGGVGDNPLITTASWESDPNSANTLGMLMSTVAHNDFGYALLNGVLTGLNTDPSSFTGGQVIYLSSSGDYTATTPTAPKHTVRIGQVVRAHATVGSVFVKIDNGYELDELHNILITSASNGDLLTYNSSSAIWTNTKSLSGSYSVTGSLTVSATMSSATASFNTLQGQVTGNLGIDSIVGWNNVTGQFLSSTIYKVGSVGTQAQISASNGLAVTGNVYVSSQISASSYIGDGSGLTNISIPKYAVFYANGITTGSNYELITINSNKYLQLQRRKNFPVSRAIGLTDSEYGWNWLNRSSLSPISSSTENISSSNAANFIHNSSSNTTWFGGTATAPTRYRNYNLQVGQSLQITTKISAYSVSNYDQTQAIVWLSGSVDKYVRFGVGYDSSINATAQANIGGTTNHSLTSGEAAAGIWWTAYVTPTHYSLYYNLSTASLTPPTSGWLFSQGNTFVNASATTVGNTISVGQMIMTGKSTPSITSTGSFHYYDVQIKPDEEANYFVPNSYYRWGATRYDTSSTEQLIGEFDLGSKTAIVDQTKLRLALVDLVNNISGDTAAVTWSAVQSNSSGASSGAFYDGASVIVSGTGRYFRLWIKITSTGDNGGSIGPFPITIPVS